jgi:hypothetical protein
VTFQNIAKLGSNLASFAVLHWSCSVLEKSPGLKNRNLAKNRLNSEKWSKPVGAVRETGKKSEMRPTELSATFTNFIENSI